MDIAVIGSNMVDLISYINRMPIEGETLEAPDFSMGCGGKGANQAVAAARLGSKVLMISKVGNDIFAQNTIDNFNTNGINTKFVHSVHGTSGVAPIFVDQNSHNSIIIVKGANNDLKPVDLLEAKSTIAECKLIVLQLEIPLQTIYAAIDLGEELNIPVLLNPAPANKELDFNYVKKCKYFVPNETELESLASMPVKTIEQVRKAGRSLIEKGCQNVIVTLGERGILWLNSEHDELITGIKVDAVDTSGAGDAFIGCLSHQIVTGSSLIDALKVANMYAAQSVLKRGTQKSYPVASEFEIWCKSR